MIHVDIANKSTNQFEAKIVDKPIAASKIITIYILHFVSEDNKHKYGIKVVEQQKGKESVY
jgi:hypothetical protein